MILGRRGNLAVNRTDDEALRDAGSLRVGDVDGVQRHLPSDSVRDIAAIGRQIEEMLLHTSDLYRLGEVRKIEDVESGVLVGFHDQVPREVGGTRDAAARAKDLQHLWSIGIADIDEMNVRPPERDRLIPADPDAIG